MVSYLSLILGQRPKAGTLVHCVNYVVYFRSRTANDITRFEDQGIGRLFTYSAHLKDNLDTIYSIVWEQKLNEIRLTVIFMRRDVDTEMFHCRDTTTNQCSNFTFVMLNILMHYTLPHFYPVNLHHSSCKHAVSIRMVKMCGSRPDGFVRISNTLQVRYIH